MSLDFIYMLFTFNIDAWLSPKFIHGLFRKQLVSTYSAFLGGEFLPSSSVSMESTERSVPLLIFIGFKVVIITIVFVARPTGDFWYKFWHRTLP